MSCSDPRRWQPKVALEAGGELPPDDRAEVAAHLDECPDCRALARDLADDRRTLRSLAAEEPPPEALDRVRRAVLTAVETEERARAVSAGRRAWQARTVLPAIAAALFALAVGLVLWLPLQDRGPETGGGPSGPGPADARPGARPDGPSATPSTADTRTQTDPSARSPELAPPRGSAAGPPPGDRLAAAPTDHLDTARGSLEEPPPDRLEPFHHRPSGALDAAPTAGDSAIKIQIVSEDPDIVFYWLTDQPQEESDDATV